MKYIAFSFLVLCLMILMAPAEAQVLFRNKHVLDLIDMKDFRNHIDPYPFEYEGSPYLDKEFVPGDIFYDNKWHIEDVPLRYNIYDDKIEYNLPEEGLVYAIDPQYKINHVILQEDTFVVNQYKDKGWFKLGFFRQVIEGPADLLVKMNVQYIEPKPARPMFDPEPARFSRRDDDIYVQARGKDLFEVKRTKKLIQYLGDHRKELTAFAKENNISAGNLEELKQFIQFYNSLQSSS